MGTKRAAEYLDMSIPALDYHVRQGNIVPTLVGKTRVFRKGDLDEFKRNRRSPGRPPKTRRSPEGGEKR